MEFSATELSKINDIDKHHRDSTPSRNRSKTYKVAVHEEDDEIEEKLDKWFNSAILSVRSIEWLNAVEFEDT